MTERYFEVDVPIRSTRTPGLRGVHVFTGRADSDSAAMKAAHEVYDAARAAAEAGLEMPHGHPDGWGACGYRPGWELDWPAAKAGPWTNPYSWLNSSPIEL
ncbi:MULTISPECIES: hypothetical protein [Streptomyces]|uniref:hypothetical protein n=1 Tax=Streptomyces TaxID=1883 RepID=UPI001316B585|nr:MULTISPECIES: hypothetical protein [Streptomyces]QGZ51652.1 hypothetical protein GPZ77_27635 [Streptomyces sp. QHH-9511]